MKHSWGTDIRRAVDAMALGEATARPGNDLRYWVSYGTVGVAGDDGKLDTKNPNAVWIGPEGVECDVRLEPLCIHVNCQYAGISAGDVTIYPPIKPGDRVLVNLPEGFAHLPVIVAILHSGSQKQPLGPDRKPIFDNNRLLVYAKTAAIDVRNAGGVQVLLEQDGKVTTTAKNVIVKADTTQLGADGLDASQNGVVLGGGTDPYTGLSYYALGSASLGVMAKK